MLRRISVVFLISALTAQEAIPLFDGRSLDGWRGDSEVWRVEDGCIVGSTVGLEQRSNTYLIWDGGEVADFELAFDVLLEGNVNNSGMQYRSRELPGGKFVVAGYQCDVHPAPDYLGMLYEERGAGILCRHGQFLVRDAEGGTRVAGRIATPRARDLGEWRTFRVVARGNVLIHELDGEPIAVVHEHKRDAPRQGILALQAHGGPPMTVRFRNITLKRLPRVEVAVQPPPPTGAARPQWIWDAEVGEEDDVFFRRCFELDGEVTSATVAATCDNHCRVYVNGARVVACHDWAAPVSADIKSHLKPGRNVIAVHGWNDGGPAALAVSVTWAIGDRRGGLVSDAAWRCSDEDPRGWNKDPDFDASGWAPATVIAPLGARGAVWSRAVKADALAVATSPDVPQLALPAEGLDGPGAEGALQILDVPRAYGSWVAICADERGRLYASDQSRGLYRVTPADGLGGLSTIEKLDVELDGAQGLCWFGGALYAVVSTRSPGLYRLRDTDGDDRLDEVAKLRELGGGGEHGPHAVVPHPDGENLIVVIGNHVKLTAIDAGMPDYEWGEDRLLPKFEDPRGHARGLKAPGGYICKVDPDGERWELICWGFRNTYDVAVLPGGEIYTYDADMEWDMGLPWYRPTRILRVAEGVDYGWRSGSNKWPADYPDSLEPVCDIGPGSPTGMELHGGSVLALDWTFGTIWALPIGSREPVEWITGAPFPVSDAVSVGEQLYVITGGRGLRSRLLRIDAAPPAAVGEPPAIVSNVDERLRSYMELLRSKPKEDYEPGARLADAVLLGLGEKFDFAAMSHRDRIAWLRVHALALQREPEQVAWVRERVLDRLLPLFPSGNDRVDADLAELLAHLDAPGFLDKAVPLLSPLRAGEDPAWADLLARNASYGGAIRKMLDNKPPTAQIAIADALRTVKHGWTLEQRRALFSFFAAAREKTGGASYDGYLKAMIDAAWETCTPAEQSLLADLVDKAKADLPKFRATKPKGPGRAWQLADAVAVAGQGLDGRDLDSGHNLYWATGCAACHYFAGEGGNHGPDLTSLGNKFSAAEVLEAILEPDKVISDQYSASVVTRTDGTTILGRAVKTSFDGAEVWEVMPAVADAELMRIPAAEVEKVEPSVLSPMPKGLVDALNPDELRDLLAFLLSRGRGR